MKKLEIIPAILPKDFDEFMDKASLVKDFVKTVQIDVCDGQFTPQASWPYKKKDDNFEKMTKEEEGLPFWENLNYEIDLMVNHPEEVVEEWVTAGASRIILHVESKGDLFEAINILDGWSESMIGFVNSLEVGLALNIDTPIEVIEKYKDKIQFIQCMGIDHIGFQGQEFDNKVIEKVKAIKSAYPQLLVSVDGGVSLENGLQLIQAGADNLVVGSAIFNSDNPIDAISKFKSINR